MRARCALSRLFEYVYFIQKNEMPLKSSGKDQQLLYQNVLDTKNSLI